MAVEIAGALAIAVLVLWLVFEPMLAAAKPGSTIPEPDAAEETRQGMALIALKEIEFDRETGKLSDEDYETLKERYSGEALRALAEEEAPAPVPLEGGGPACDRCGPCPEPDALFCSSCGRRLAADAYCAGCGAPLEPDSRFCAACGIAVAA